AQIETAAPRCIGNERERDTGVVAKGQGCVSLGKDRGGTDIFDPTALRSPNSLANRPLSVTPGAPGMMDAFQVSGVAPGTCYRPHRSFGIIFTVANPRQVNLSCFHQDVADRLQSVLLAARPKECTVASTDGLQIATDARRIIPYRSTFVVHM